MSIPMRRIVTGHDANGRSIVISDGPTPNLYGSPEDPVLINFWATEGSPANYDDPVDPAAAGPIALGPRPGGATFRYFRIPPESRSAHLSHEEKEARIAAYYKQVGDGNAHVPGGRHAGFHRTKSVDYIILLEGEVTLMLDEVDVPMKQYDVVIQRGTNHSWVNYGETPALMMAVLVDGDRDR